MNKIKPWTSCLTASFRCVASSMLLLCFDLLAPVILKRLEWPENKLLVCFFYKKRILGNIGSNQRAKWACVKTHFCRDRFPWRAVETVKPYREAKKNRFLLLQRGFWQQENADRIGYLWHIKSIMGVDPFDLLLRATLKWYGGPDLAPGALSLTFAW